MENKPLPPARKPPLPRGGECRLSYKNGSIAITTPPHPSSSHSATLKVFRGFKKAETGMEDEMMVRGWNWTAVTSSCQNIKSGARALL